MNEVYVEAYDEKNAPPSQPVVRFSKVANQVFIGIFEKEESYEEAKYTMVAETGIKKDDLLDALVGAGIVELTSPEHCDIIE